MSYPGGKGAIYQWLINEIPPHNVFVSTHLGDCAVMRNKRPAAVNIGIDIDERVIDAWRQGWPGGPPGAGPIEATARSGDTGDRVTAWLAARQGPPLSREMVGADGAHFRFLCIDAIKYLKSANWQGSEFIYSDPPYLFSTRKQQTPIYRNEYTEADHVALLETLRGLPCNVMISGYQSDLYDRYLPGWRKSTTRTITRGGTPAVEVIWMNYDPPTRLHDYRFLGTDYRERERIRKRKRRWAASWAKMERLERLAVLAAMQESGLGG